MINEIPEDEIGTKYAVLTELPVRYKKDRKVLSKIVKVLKVLNEPEWQVMIIRMLKEVDWEHLNKTMHTNAELKRLVESLCIYL